MVGLNPILSQISPTIWEYRWNLHPSADLRMARMMLEEWIWDTFPEHLLETRHGSLTLCIVWRSSPPTAWASHPLPTALNPRTQPSHRWKIPIWYHGDDLSLLAKSKGMSKQEVIELHSTGSYLLDFYGFLPGFMYLSGLNPALYHSRKKIPDRTIKAGSVAIGGKQTGIYPQDSPGGWHILGQSPLCFFDPFRDPPVGPKPGDHIIFSPISQQEYQVLQKSLPYPQPF